MDDIIRVMENPLKPFRIFFPRFCAIAMVALVGISMTACPPSSPLPPPPPLELAGSVSITGIPRVGETLGVNLRNLSGSGNVSFEWMADGTPFGNNRGATLPLDALHAGRTITVTVTTSYNSGGLTSLPVGPVIAAGGTMPALTGTVSITGNPRVGQMLRANVDYLDGNGAISFEWKTDGTPFENSHGRILPLDGLHVGRTISVTARRANNSGHVASPPVGPVIFGDETAPTLTGSIIITGNPYVGQMLRVNVNNLSGSGEIFHEWKVGNETVGTGDTLFLIPADVGQTVTVTVIRENNFGNVTSPPVGPITLRPLLTGTVRITGVPQVGQILMANTIGLGGSGAMSFVWKAGGAQIGTGNTLPLLGHHVGQIVTVTVTRANNDGSVTSPPVGPVEAIPPLTGTIAITGVPQAGQTLGVNTAGLGGSGAMSFVWGMAGSQVGTGSTLPLQNHHVGQTVTVTVTRANNTGSVTSPPVGPITPAPQPPPPPPALTITVTGIPWHYMNHWGAIDLESERYGWVAESAWIRISGTSATFTMSTGPAFTPGVHWVYFSIDDAVGNPVGDYITPLRSISAGHNTIPFSAFSVNLGRVFSENLESAEERTPAGNSRARTRR